MSNSGLNAYQDELLTILIEECGEAIQEACKINRFGIDAKSHHIAGSNHKACLIQELGDIIAVVELLIDSDMGITEELLDMAKERKLKKIGKWMTAEKPEIEFDGVADVMSKTLSLAQRQLDNYKAAK